MTADPPVDVLRLGGATLPLHRAAEPGHLRLGLDADPPGTAALALLTALRHRTEVRCDHGTATLHAPDRPLPPVTGSRRLAAGHTNTLDIVDERFAVKWYAEPALGTTREQQLLARLTAARCRVTPAVAGALTWRTDGPPTTLAVVTAYLPGATDGWTLLEHLDPLRAEDELRSLCRSFGTALAELHTALAPGSYIRLGSATRLAGISARITAARAVCRGDLPVPELPRHATDLTAQDVHGDVHLGQFLVADGRVHVTDLEGDPTEQPYERVRPDTPLRDLASLRRSVLLAHLWRRDRHGDPPAARAVYDRALAALTDAYAVASGGLPAGWTSWLPLLELEKAAGEVLYARRFLPEWLLTARACYADAAASLEPEPHR
ncbi:hypothetical protein ACIQVK_33740 [Streptomyces sp. NPDC090493]|uniref:hypothetical protein n=1 Tax=Streptomyces sp. NPDC090493 TaxID=3365964 RepID=UPI00381C3760